MEYMCTDSIVILLMVVSSVCGNPIEKTIFNRDTSKDLIFPESLEYDKMILNRKQTPKCRNSFCEQVEHYPERIFENVLKKSKYRTEFFDTLFAKDDFSQRFWENEENFICTSQKKTIFPKLAQNIDKEWKFIYNFRNYTQGVRIEVCRKEASCNLFGNTPLDITTRCKQKFMERRLLSADADGNPVMDYFKLPSACACSYKRNIGFGRFKRRVSSPDG